MTTTNPHSAEAEANEAARERTLVQMTALAFSSYVGLSTTEVLGGKDTSIAQSLRWTLDSLLPLEKQWELVWGPSTKRFALTIFDENMAFVVQHREDPSRYALVIRGTNPISLANWVLEDFVVFHQVAWDRKNPQGARISLGTKLGLEVLKELRPEAGLPGAGTSLREFLAGEVQKAAGGINLALVGHSLGGALAPTFALWLDESRTGTSTRAPWDPTQKTSLEVYSLAGPTPGDAQFAGRYDARLGSKTRRIWNYYDVVPHAWELDSIKNIDKLYEPTLASNAILRGLARLASLASKNGNYCHLAGKGERRDGSIVPGFDFAWEMAYQHTLPYAAIALTSREIAGLKAKGPEETRPSPEKGGDAFAFMMQKSLEGMMGATRSPSPPVDRSISKPPPKLSPSKLARIPASLLSSLVPAKMHAAAWKD